MNSTLEAPASIAESASSNGHQANGKPLMEKPAGDRWMVVSIPVAQVEPSPYQPRLSFDEAEMVELVASVRAKGVQQPVIVRTHRGDWQALHTAQKNGGTETVHTTNGNPNPKQMRYQLIAGERRLRACIEAGRKAIPAIIRDDLSDAECAELALMENVQRSNLSPIEEARGYKRLMVEFHMKEERIAKKVGKSVATIKDILKLLQLPEAVQQLLAEKKLTASHGQELLALAPHERICELVASHTVAERLTAVSLQTILLPNITQLKKLGLVTELDWRTKFDWKSQCGECPLKAYVFSGNPYCLRPDEWHAKQEAAIEQKKLESVRIMEEARQQNGPVEADSLPPGSFVNLSYNDPPVGCTETCPCRSEAIDPDDPTNRVPICLNRERFRELEAAARQAKMGARRKLYRAMWEEARDVLKTDVEGYDLRRLATLLAVPVLRSELFPYANTEEWAGLAHTVSASVGVYVPWDDLLNEAKNSSELYAFLHSQLEAQQPEKLILLCVSLMLAYEANQVIEFDGETPGLDFVLGRVEVENLELPTELAEVV